jgi:hypothetical protein
VQELLGVITSHWALPRVLQSIPKIKRLAGESDWHAGRACGAVLACLPGMKALRASFEQGSARILDSSARRRLSNFIALPFPVCPPRAIRSCKLNRFTIIGLGSFCKPRRKAATRRTTFTQVALVAPTASSVVTR